MKSRLPGGYSSRKSRYGTAPASVHPLSWKKNHRGPWSTKSSCVLGKTPSKSARCSPAVIPRSTASVTRRLDVAPVPPLGREAEGGGQEFVVRLPSSAS